jgi:hypothetical protein
MTTVPFQHLRRRPPPPPDSLSRWIRVYDHTDATYYEDNLREMMEQDDPDNQSSYKFPQVKASIPEFLPQYGHADI